MKTLSIALITASVALGGLAPVAALADAPSYKEQMTSLWVLTGDANYGRLAGLSAQQINDAKQLPIETQSLVTADQLGD